MLWDHTQLYLIMDYVEQDLRQFMDSDPRSRSVSTVKVALVLSYPILASNMNICLIKQARPLPFDWDCLYRVHSTYTPVSNKFEGGQTREFEVVK